MSEREIPAIMELIPAEGEGKLTDSQDIAALMSKWKLHLLNQGLANSFLKRWRLNSLSFVDRTRELHSRPSVA